MIRKAKIISRSSDNKRVICIDLLNYEQIFKYVSQDSRHIKKFRHINEIILGGLQNTELYSKEEIDKKSKGVTAMKFFKGQENDRIYCKEQTVDGKVFVIVAAELFLKKKTQKNNQKIKNIIHKVAKYEYEIEE